MREGGSTGEVVPLVENEDYYLDHGLMVFTARYHLRRGYCCDRGCRHCPYAETPKIDSQRDADSNEATK
jgi:hypothetical protein